MPDLITARVSASEAAKWKYVNTTWPLRMQGHSGSIGSLTLTIISAFAQTSPALGTSVPPVSRYASSPKPEPRPAPCSTNTVCPSPTSDSTPAGTRATRFSAVLISFGTPTIMLEPLLGGASVGPEPDQRLAPGREELGRDLRHPIGRQRTDRGEGRIQT